MKYFVYLLVSKKNGKFFSYVGITNDLQNRITKHNSSKGAKYTRGKKWYLAYKKSYNSKSKALKEVKKGIENNKDDLDLKLRLVAMQISSGLIPDAKSSLSKMQHLDKNIFKKLIDIYPEVLKDKSMNQFFDFYNDNSSK